MLREPLVSQLFFVAILSVNLAVLNVLPFPPLDGGRIAVVAVEAIRRRRLPAEREALVYLTGFMVLIVLVILISIRTCRGCRRSDRASGWLAVGAPALVYSGRFRGPLSGPNRY